MLGTGGLEAVVMMLPVFGNEDVNLAEQIPAFLLVLLPVGALLYGLLVLDGVYQRYKY